MIREPREVPTSYIDDANDNPFLSIGTLLVGDLGAHIREKVPTKTLAKAIRESGIYELGAFSELGLADEDGEAKALGALALQDAWEADSRPREYKDSRSPVELFCDIFADDGEYSFNKFGWPKEVVPDEVAPYLHAVRDGQAIQHIWQEYTRPKIAIKRQMAKWSASTTPTTGDLVHKENRLADLRQQLAKVEQDASDVCKADGEPFGLAANPCQAVSAAQIIQHFKVFQDFDQNKKWWKGKMRDAKRYKLDVCRVGAGRPGPQGSLWRPDLVAEWVSNPRSKREGSLSTGRAKTSLKMFPGCDAVADEIFPSEI